jgi:hypothetical protein
VSAFMVSRLHVACLAKWHAKRLAAVGHTVMCEDMERIANLLSMENARSVNFRYPNHPAELPHVFTFHEIDRAPELTAIQALKSADCLRYQSCERPDYERTDAFSIVQRIRSEAIAMLPGYHEAPWCIDEDSVGLSR